MEAFIYFYSNSGQALDVFEDALGEVLGDEGEVTGTGSGATGSNFDVEVFEGDARRFLDQFREALKREGAPKDAVIVIEGERYPL